MRWGSRRRKTWLISPPIWRAMSIRVTIVPFLTSKHSIEYCLMHASRAASHGFEALTVLGGDHTAGPPRCVPHARELRALIRQRVPRPRPRRLGQPSSAGNEQVDYLLDDDSKPSSISPRSCLTTASVRWSGFSRRPAGGVCRIQGSSGCFFTGAPLPATLAQAGRLLPGAGRRTDPRIRSRHDARGDLRQLGPRCLSEVGADKVYLSNLGVHQVEVSTVVS